MTSENRQKVKSRASTGKPSGKHTERSFIKGIYDSLASVTLAIFLLIILAMTSIVGTVVLQNGRPEQYLKEYGPGAYRLFQSLALDDMYRSWWFLTLLVLLLVNITFCSIKRFPRTWRLMTQSPAVLDESLFRRMKFRGSVRRGVPPGEAEERIRDLLTDRFGKFTENRNEEAVTFFVDRGWYGRMGAYVVHLSILLLAIGAIYGGAVGFKGFVTIVEGQTINRVPLRGRNAAVKLPFDIRCDDFQVIYYPGTRQPKDYYSDLVVIRDGKEVQKKRIEVNHPLIVDGIYFYQSSYGVDRSSTVTFDVLDPSGKVAAPSVTVSVGQPFNVIGDSSTYGIQQILPSYSGGRPAVQMSRIAAGGRQDFFISMAAPDRDKLRGGPVYFRIRDANIREYTGLQVAWDPGVPLVWIASSVMIGGLFIAFFIPHRRVWLRVELDPENTAVLMAGSTNRNPASFEKEFDGALAALKQALKKDRGKDIGDKK